MPQFEADALRRGDEGEPAQDVLRVPPLVPAGAYRLDQLALLVVPQGRDGQTRPVGSLADGEQRLGHPLTMPGRRLDLKRA